MLGTAAHLAILKGPMLADLLGHSLLGALLSIVAVVAARSTTKTCTANSVQSESAPCLTGISFMLMLHAFRCGVFQWR
jgi:hypothetical protein